MQRILVATDLSPRAGIAVARACQIGAGHCATLHLLHVVPHAMNAVDRALRAEELAEITHALSLRHPCLCAVTSSIREAPTDSAIRGEAEDRDADIIVIGGHRTKHLLDPLFGTTVDHLLRNMSRPVLIARTAVHGPYRHVYVASVVAERIPEALVLAAHISAADAEMALTTPGRSGEAGGAVPEAGPGDAITACDSGARTAISCGPDLLVIAAPVPWIPAAALRGSGSGNLNEQFQADILVCPAPAHHRDTPHPGGSKQTSRPTASSSSTVVKPAH